MNRLTRSIAARKDWRIVSMDLAVAAVDTAHKMFSVLKGANRNVIEKRGKLLWRKNALQ